MSDRSVNDERLLQMHGTPAALGPQIADLREQIKSASDETVYVILEVNTGQLEKQAIARVELERRRREREDKTLEKQHEIANKHLKIVKMTTIVASIAAAATVLISIMTIIDYYSF